MNINATANESQKPDKSLLRLFAERTAARAQYKFGKALLKDPEAFRSKINSSYIDSAEKRLVLGHAEKAQKLIIKSIGKYPVENDSGAALRLVLVAEKVAEALETEQKYYKAADLLLETLSVLGEISKLSFSDKAIAACEKAATHARGEENFSIAAHYYEAALKNADTREKIAELRSNLADTYVAEAKSYRNYLNLAGRSIENAIKYAPERREELYGMVAQWHVEGAEQDMSNGNMYSACREIETALAYAPSRKEELYAKVADHYVKAAESDMRNRMIFSAVQNVDSAIRFAPLRGRELAEKVADYYAQRADEDMRNGLIFSAVQNVDSAISYSPERRTALYEKVADWYVKQARSDLKNKLDFSAKSNVECAIRCSPGRKDALYDELANWHLVRAQEDSKNRLFESARGHLRNAASYATSEELKAAVRRIAGEVNEAGKRSPY